MTDNLLLTICDKLKLPFEKGTLGSQSFGRKFFPKIFYMNST